LIPLIVLDTMVVIAAVIGRPSGAAAQVVRAVATGEIQLAISDEFLSEIVRVMDYPEVEVLVHRPVQAFEVALDIGTMGFMYHPRRLMWPTLSDIGDSWVFDLAYESDADYIVSCDGAIHNAGSELGFLVVYPGDLLEVLRQQEI
jgi:putative PIN family toxin of toxin-antitoxin system